MMTMHKKVRVLETVNDGKSKQELILYFASGGITHVLGRWNLQRGTQGDFR